MVWTVPFSRQRRVGNFHQRSLSGACAAGPAVESLVATYWDATGLSSGATWQEGSAALRLPLLQLSVKETLVTRAYCLCETYKVPVLDGPDLYALPPFSGSIRSPALFSVAAVQRRSRDLVSGPKKQHLQPFVERPWISVKTPAVFMRVLARAWCCFRSGRSERGDADLSHPFRTVALWLCCLALCLSVHLDLHLILHRWFWLQGRGAAAAHILPRDAIRALHASSCT